jgi:hypothetical protein
MNKQAIKDVVYGGLLELMNNRTYFYKSPVGSDYSHWTDEGQKALTEFMGFMAGKMVKAEEAELDRRAKEMVIKGLKGESI